VTPDDATMSPTHEEAVRNYQRLGTVEAIKLGFLNHLKYTLATDELVATDRDKYVALAMTVRDRLIERWIATAQTYHGQNVKRVYYLSMEYLIGRAMGNNVLSLGLEDVVTRAAEDLGIDWGELREVERDAALGTGGLGRLAACYLDSMATLELPGYGYGLRYDFGIFRQEIRDGRQVEEPDNWLRHGDPWQIERPEYQFPVHFGGTVRNEHDSDGKLAVRWIPAETVIGVPYDFPIAGYHNNTVNNLRLWTAKATEEFDLDVFNEGDFLRAYQNKILSENITKVLYPNDLVAEGRELRFQQEYFFVSCSLQDIFRRFKRHNPDPADLPEKAAIQLNDTHPSLAITELMRILLDDERMTWDAAWDATVRTFGYTNHTLMPEALEKWPVRFFEQFLPRHLSIVYEINRRFLRQVRNKFPDDPERVARMSLIEEGAEKQVRMAHLSVVGSHVVNGVSEVHSELVRRQLFPDFHALWPDRFTGITNGITQRRWLLKANPDLAALITDHIGDGWVTNLHRLRDLLPLAEDEEFKEGLRRVKRENKVRLAEFIQRAVRVEVDPDSLFDAQAKRLHEYKRQLLNVMHIYDRYHRLKENPDLDVVPRTFLFAAKAAPGYQMAKLIIKLIHDFADIINSDPEVNGKLRIVFLPDYRVSLAERIIPATDLSEQISVAGTEASGTGNMKFALNGALTIGTLDGANIEIRDQVGPDNFFLFGHTIEEIEALRRPGTYDPWHYYQTRPEVRRILDALGGDFFNLEEPGLYGPIRRRVLEEGDPYFHLADFDSYLQRQQEVDQAYRDPDRWARMVVANIASMGFFSSDRAVAEYARDVWDCRPCPVELGDTGMNRTWFPEDRHEDRLHCALDLKPS
jgi:starch phosphorylase